MVWLGLALVALLLIAWGGVNLYVQSHETQARLQQELSQRLGLPLQVQRVSVTPWADLKLSGITVGNTPNEERSSFLTAKSLHLRVKFISLFRRPLIVRDVSLVDPLVIWPQDEKGKWRLPNNHSPAPPAVPHRLPSGPAPGLAAPPPTHSPPSAPSPIASFSPGENAASFPQIGRVRLVNGSIHFLDQHRQAVAAFDGVDFSSEIRTGNELRGDARVAKTALRDRIFLTALRSPLRYDSVALELPKIQAQLANGTLHGLLHLQTQAPGSPFTAHLEFDKVDANELITQAGGGRDILRGRLQGTCVLSGESANPDSLTGEGTLSLQGGHVQQFAVLAAIGQLLQIDELTQLDLQQAEAKFRIANGQVLIDRMTLQSPNLRLVSTGSVSLQGKLALESNLAINDKIRSQLFRSLRDNFIATDEPGMYALNFHVTGTVGNPRTDLVERAIGTNLKDLGSVVDALLGRGKPKKKKKQQLTPAEASPTETPGDAVSPSAPSSTPSTLSAAPTIVPP